MRQVVTWDPLLQCLLLDKGLLQQQNTKKLQGTKNSCVHVQWGKIRNKKIQKDPKPSKSRGLLLHPALALFMYPAPRTTEGWATHLSYPSSSTPGSTPALNPHKESAVPHSPPSQGAREGICFLFLLPGAAVQVPT